MKKTSFSLIIPTRDRPRFIETSLRFIDSQDYSGDFEVIVVDNPSEESENCETVCNKKRKFRVKYVRPGKPIEMVSNWNLGLLHSENEYVGYLTDKMFLLPGILERADQLIRKTDPDIVTWLANIYSPDRFPEYFGPGSYFSYPKSKLHLKKFSTYNALEHLDKMLIAKKPREQQNQSEYNRGKICFGLFSRRLIDEIIAETGNLFHPIAPDYTSRVLGCNFSKKAVQINYPGIVHINTDLSNGGLFAIDDKHALKFLNSFKNFNLFISDLYVSNNNQVLSDYINTTKLIHGKHNPNKLNWSKYIYKDLYFKGRNWSSEQIEIEQKMILDKFLIQNFTGSEIRKIKKYPLSVEQLNESLSTPLLQSLKTTPIQFLPQRIKATINYILSTFIKTNQIKKVKSLIEIIS